VWGLYNLVESERGCGYRAVGGVYLCGSGGSRVCDALPVVIDSCACCDFVVKQSRSMQSVHAGFLASKLVGHKCKEAFKCPTCYFVNEYPFEKTLSKIEKKKRGVPKVFYLMFVSRNSYSPKSFVKEAREVGISKRIAPNCLPKHFRVGKDFVFLAHRDVPFTAKLEAGTLEAEPVYKRAIFHVFRPDRVELLLWKGTSSETIRGYEDAGYTVVLVDPSVENKSKHAEVSLPKLPIKRGLK